MFADDEAAMVAARACWAKRQHLEAGQLLFERIPQNDVPSWAARVLQAAIEHSRIQHRLFNVVLECAADPAKWDNGHQVFSKVRKEILKPKPSTEVQRKTYLLLFVAELVAKLTYNASSPLGPFDDDTGFWLLKCSVDFAEETRSLTLMDRIWELCATSRAC